MLNQNLKAANDNLIERLATNELNHATPTSQQEISNTKILMIGDSNARRLEQILSKNANFTLKLHQIATLRKARTDIRSNNLPPQWEENQIVLLLLGTNDIQNGTKARQTQQMTIELAKAIIEKGKKVIESEVPPFRENIEHEMEAKIHNKMISTIPSTFPFITLLTYREEIAEYPDQETFTDHVHLDPNSQAAQTIAQLIAQHITSIDIAPIPTQQFQFPPKPTKLFATTTDYTTTNTKPYTRTFTISKDQAGLVIGVRQAVLNRL
jgi:lysophospholipase L1-like esterase